MNRAFSLVATGFAVAGLAACSAPDVAPIPAAEVAEEIADQFEEETGSRPEVTCPGDLAAEEGTVMVCDLVGGNPPAEFEVELTVTSVGSDGTVTFDLRDRAKETTEEPSEPATGEASENGSEPTGAETEESTDE